MLFSSFPSVIPYLLTLWILYLTPFFPTLGSLSSSLSLYFLLHHLSSFSLCHTPLCFFMFCLSLLHCSLSPHLIFTSLASRPSLYLCPNMLLFFHPLLFSPLLPVILYSPSVSPRSAPLLPRRWGRGRHRGRTASFLFWLRHALPDRLLEGSVCLCSSHGLPERLGMFHHLYHYNRPAHGRHRRPGISLRLHYWPKGLSHCCGFCGTRHLSPRWVQE